MRVVIIGGGVMGNSVAYHLLVDPDFHGEVVIVECDPSLARSSSALSLAGMRQQFSQPVNVRLSLESVAFLRRADEILEVDNDRPLIALREPGYLILARADQLDRLAENHRTQIACGADILMLSPDDLGRRFPWLAHDDIAAAAWGRTGEGWFDGYALMQAFARKARSLGAQQKTARATGLRIVHGRAEAVMLSDGSSLPCDVVVNAAGPWAGAFATSAGVALPVHPRRRSVFLFSCRTSLPGCPVVFDPKGVSFRTEGENFVCTAPPSPLDDVDDLPLEPDHALFEEHIWPVLAERVPAFEAIRLLRAWAGYYEMNLFDQNGIIGSHPDIPNFFFLTGFSGHGIQQSPAAGRGLAELIVHGGYRTLDLSELSFERLVEGRALKERNVFG